MLLHRAMNKLRPILLVLTAVAALSVAYPARPNFIETIDQVGTNVVATGSGAFNLTGLTFVFSVNTGGIAVHASSGLIATGPAGPLPAEVYTGYTGPTSFGSGGIFLANAGFGDLVGINVFGDRDLVLPQNYASGTALSDRMTFDNKTFASLGLTPGTYEWTWGTGMNADSFTLQIGTVPDAGSTLPLLGFASLGLVALRRKLRC
jgi:hypothetical protein